LGFGSGLAVACLCGLIPGEGDRSDLPLLATAAHVERRRARLEHTLVKVRVRVRVRARARVRVS